MGFWNANSPKIPSSPGAAPQDLCERLEAVLQVGPKIKKHKSAHDRKKDDAADQNTDAHSIFHLSIVLSAELRVPDVLEQIVNRLSTVLHTQRILTCSGDLQSAKRTGTCEECSRIGRHTPGAKAPLFVST